MYRIDLPMWALRRIGHEAVSIIGLDNAPEDTDVVVGQVIVDPNRAQLWKQLREREGRRPVLIFEMDDDIWNVHNSNVAAAGMLRDVELTERIEECIRLSDAVTVTTERLYEVVSQFNEHVYVVPNCIDGHLLEQVRSEPERPTFGWTVSSSHSMDVDVVSGLLSHYLRRHPDVDLHLIGQDFRDRFKAPNTRWTMWSHELSDYWAGIDFHVGIAPLMVHQFNKARSDIKALEYAALGIPVIASEFGPYPSSIRHGENGFLVKRDHEWGKYLNELLFDDELRATMSAHAKAWARERTIQGNVWRWEQVFSEAIERVHGTLHADADQSSETIRITESLPTTAPVAAAALAAPPVSAEPAGLPALPLRIEAWAQGSHASALYRVAMPAAALNRLGHSARAFVGGAADVDTTADLIVAQTVVQPMQLECVRSIVQTPGRRAAVIVELDDAYWHIHDSNTSVTWLRERKTLDIVEESLRLADAVTVTTEPLAQLVRQFNPNVHVLPNCIDMNLLLDRRPEADKVTVGWSGSVSHVVDFEVIGTNLARLAVKRPELDWNFIGPDFRTLTGLTGGRHTPPNYNLEKYYSLIDFHVGLAPLAPIAFNLSKSDLRILEYSALGIPVVGSNFGEYGKSITHGETGLLVDCETDWAAHVEFLADDVNARQLMGINARIWASERTIQGNAWRWEQVYRQTVARVRGEEFATAG